MFYFYFTLVSKLSEQEMILNFLKYIQCVFRLCFSTQVVPAQNILVTTGEKIITFVNGVQVILIDLRCLVLWPVTFFIGLMRPLQSVQYTCQLETYNGVTVALYNTFWSSAISHTGIHSILVYVISISRETKQTVTLHLLFNNYFHCLTILNSLLIFGTGVRGTHASKAHCYH